jgi:hypothetical protein
MNDNLDSQEALALEEKKIELAIKRAVEADRDAREDAQRNMAWFALFGMLLYPFAVVLADFMKLTTAPNVLGSMAPTYFVSVAAIVAAFYSKEAISKHLANKS